MSKEDHKYKLQVLRTAHLPSAMSKKEECKLVIPATENTAIAKCLIPDRIQAKTNLIRT
uniref:Uncharacterized protein n=1 Tax=Rhizophora mucronata TaxID=61149 RepID=A0A2P2Q0T6_RHIMU